MRSHITQPIDFTTLMIPRKLEADLDGTAPDSYAPTLAARLLVLLTGDRCINLTNWESRLRREYLRREPGSNPLGTEPVKTKAKAAKRAVGYIYIAEYILEPERSLPIPAPTLSEMQPSPVVEGEQASAQAQDVPTVANLVPENQSNGTIVEGQTANTNESCNTLASPALQDHESAPIIVHTDAVSNLQPGCASNVIPSNLETALAPTPSTVPEPLPVDPPPPETDEAPQTIAWAELSGPTKLRALYNLCEWNFASGHDVERFRRMVVDGNSDWRQERCGVDSNGHSYWFTGAGVDCRLWVQRKEPEPVKKNMITLRISGSRGRGRGKGSKSEGKNRKRPLNDTAPDDESPCPSPNGPSTDGRRKSSTVSNQTPKSKRPRLSGTRTSSRLRNGSVADEWQTLPAEWTVVANEASPSVVPKPAPASKRLRKGEQAEEAQTERPPTMIVIKNAGFLGSKPKRLERIVSGTRASPRRQAGEAAEGDRWQDPPQRWLENMDVTNTAQNLAPAHTRPTCTPANQSGPPKGPPSSSPLSSELTEDLSSEESGARAFEVNVDVKMQDGTTGEAPQRSASDESSLNASPTPIEQASTQTEPPPESMSLDLELQHANMLSEPDPSHQAESMVTEETTEVGAQAEPMSPIIPKASSELLTDHPSHQIVEPISTEKTMEIEPDEALTSTQNGDTLTKPDLCPQVGAMMMKEAQETQSLGQPFTSQSSDPVTNELADQVEPTMTKDAMAIQPAAELTSTQNVGSLTKLDSSVHVEQMITKELQDTTLEGHTAKLETGLAHTVRERTRDKPKDGSGDEVMTTGSEGKEGTKEITSNGTELKVEMEIDTPTSGPNGKVVVRADEKHAYPALKGHPLDPEWIGWEVVCSDLAEWQQFSRQFEGTQNADEIALVNFVTEGVLPILVEAYAEHEKRLKLEESLAHRKRSNRIATREVVEVSAAEAAAASRERESRLHSERLEAKRLKEKQADEERKEKEEDQRLVRLREREERIAIREAQLMMEREAEKKREERAKLRAEAKVLGLAVKVAKSGVENSVTSAESGENWELNCEICGVIGQNMDDGSEVICCDKCEKWQHLACHDKADEIRRQPKRNWTTADFICSTCSGIPIPRAVHKLRTHVNGKLKPKPRPRTKKLKPEVDGIPATDGLEKHSAQTTRPKPRITLYVSNPNKQGSAALSQVYPEQQPSSAGQSSQLVDQHIAPALTVLGNHRNPILQQSSTLSPHISPALTGAQSILSPSPPMPTPAVTGLEPYYEDLDKLIPILRRDVQLHRVLPVAVMHRVRRYLINQQQRRQTSATHTGSSADSPHLTTSPTAPNGISSNEAKPRIPVIAQLTSAHYEQIPHLPPISTALPTAANWYDERNARNPTSFESFVDPSFISPPHVSKPLTGSETVAEAQQTQEQLTQAAQAPTLKS
ncbi:hypothetical protein CROQUDRAFT_130278 [Cronartium quercuum f. sp. fusiforme G11]|uniref:PHD-type domain-containing protein n=1 Tax=Cronartium quercuum f. sp. fusiforme G11 TaxID=708437 RepID=A0A9P6TG50_9BASI|nr:hypothetical protein CROQUDRAFT_130278 [Cronartium quercuum f. sp. fusiforme G11]